MHGSWGRVCQESEQQVTGFTRRMQVGGVLQDRVAGGMAFSIGFLLLEVVLLMAARGEAQGVS